MLKSYFDLQWASVKVGIVFSTLGIPPNVWTVFSLVPAIAGFWALTTHNLAAALALFIASGFIDIVDGAVARVTKSVSNLGAFLDGIIDRYVEILMYLGLAYYLKGAPDLFIPSEIWIMVLIFGTLMPSFVRAYADHRDVVCDRDDQRRMGGVIERFERLSIVYLGMLAGIVWGTSLLTAAIALAAVATNLTALQRIAYVVSYKKKG